LNVKRIVCYSLLAFILLATFSTQAALTQTNAGFSLYENHILGIRIQYPSDWEWEQDYDRVSFSLAQDDPGFKLVVSVFPTGNRSLDQLIMNMPERFWPNFGFIESPKKITLGAYPAGMMVYNFTEEENEVKAMRVLTQREDKAYDIVYIAESIKYNDYLPTVEKMISSFKTMSQDNLSTKPDFLTYHNSTYGVAIQYPSSWVKDERGDGSDDCHARVITFTHPSGKAQLIIYVEYQDDSLYKGYTHKEILEAELEFYRDYKNPDFYDDFKVIESDINSTLAGYPAYKLEYTQKAGDTQYNSLQIGTEINSDGYFITADAEAENYSAYFPTIQKMISSFKMEQPKDFVCLVAGKPPVLAEDINKTTTEFKPGTNDSNKTTTELNAGRM
jgi:PsbP-like protein